MKLALIPPISWLATTDVTNYQLMLPHLLRDHRYSDHYRRLAKMKNQYIILDNGEAEGQNNLTPAQLVGSAIYHQVNEVVVPDVMCNQVETINRMDEFFKAIRQIRNDAFDARMASQLNYMGVAQGSTYPEVRDCIDIMMELHGDKLKTIALPRHLLDTIGDHTIRLDLANYIFSTFTGPQGGIEIHCLGASPSWPKEMQALGNQGIVRGMDTSMPYNYAFYGEYVEDPGLLIKRPDRYFDLRSGLFKNDCVHHNVGVMKRWANGE